MLCPMEILIIAIGVTFAVTVHEFCHAWVADRLGDPTPRIQGRISLNPIRHFDFFGTLSLILFKFGWGKPVEFNPHNLRFPKRDSALIALAGPMANLVTALALSTPLKLLAQQLTTESSTALVMLFVVLKGISDVSVILFSLNVLPFPPLDGSKIIGIFIPRRFERKYNEYLHHGQQYAILFILFDVFFLRNVFGFSVLGTLVGGIAQWVFALVSLGA